MLHVAVVSLEYLVIDRLLLKSEQNDHADSGGFQPTGFSYQSKTSWLNVLRCIIKLLCKSLLHFQGRLALHLSFSRMYRAAPADSTLTDVGAIPRIKRNFLPAEVEIITLSLQITTRAHRAVLHPPHHQVQSFCPRKLRLPLLRECRSPPKSKYISPKPR